MEREQHVAMGLSVAPSVVALLVLTVAGRGSDETVAALVRVAPAEIEGHGSVFPYLSDTFTSSFERVVHGPGNKPFSIFVGFVLAAALGVLRPQLCSVRPGDVGVDPAYPVLRVAWTTTAALAAVVLFALGSTGCAGSAPSASPRCSPADPSCCSTAARC